MEELKLPIIKTKRYKQRWLSMNDYLVFVVDNLKHTVDINFVRRLKRGMFAGKPFVLK